MATAPRRTTDVEHTQQNNRQDTTNTELYIVMGKSGKTHCEYQMRFDK
jgi:hypothetical protein